jgi:hypothetical protein
MRYQQVANQDDDDHMEGPPVPSSPPPPFTSRPASPSSQRLLSDNDPLTSEADRTLIETFDSPSDDEGSDVDEDDSSTRRLVRSDADNASAQANGPTAAVETRVTQYPAFATTTSRVYGGGNANDGVFANLSAKPSHTEEVDEKPPVCLYP